jgi:hypothetical protein
MSSVTRHSDGIQDGMDERPKTVNNARQRHNSIVTHISVPAPAALLWEGLMFYEQIGRRLPILLRLLLPAPIRTEGRRSRVGDVVKCHYVGGHLLKRVTEITSGRSYEFEIIEQNVTVGPGIRLLSGSYTMRDLPGHHTEIGLMTRYSSSNRPRWLWARIEAAVCHSFHRHILSAMRNGMGNALNRS